MANSYRSKDKKPYDNNLGFGNHARGQGLVVWPFHIPFLPSAGYILVGVKYETINNR